MPGGKKWLLFFTFIAFIALLRLLRIVELCHWMPILNVWISRMVSGILCTSQKLTRFFPGALIYSTSAAERCLYRMSRDM